MKIAIFIIISLAILVLGGWIYRGFIRPIDPLSEEVLGLAKYLNKSGIEGSPYPVRHGFRHSYMLSAAAFKIENYPLPILIGVYPSSDIAGKSAVNDISHSAIGNDNLVISFPAWGDDTEPMKSKIVKIFNEYKKN